MLHSIGKVDSKYCVTLERLKQITDKPPKSIFTFDDGYADNLTCGRDCFSRLRNRPIIFPVVGKIGGINDWDTLGELSGKPLLTWEQIGTLQSLGVRFGSHSLTHADLTKLGDLDLEREVKESKRVLEEKLGQEVEGFAYPFGFFDERVITAVKAAGYKWAVTTSDSIWEGWGDPYRLRRISISGLDPDWLLSAKMNGLYDIKAVWELPVLAAEKLVSILRNKA
jgi:peptidoglycan/xylan/chitin deacetylase (PgdA/CDA1 family)